MLLAVLSRDTEFILFLWTAGLAEAVLAGRGVVKVSLFSEARVRDLVVEAADHVLVAELTPDELFTVPDLFL